MKQENTDPYVKIGTFGRPYSIHGWLKVHSVTQPPKAIIQYQPWYIQNQQNKWELLQIDNLRIHNNTLIVHIENIDEPEMTKDYVNKDISIPYSHLPKLPKGQFYWADMIGMTVLNKDNVNLGIVDHLLETPANDVLVVLGKKRHLIPFLRNHTIQKIDMDSKIIHVDWDADF